MSFNTAIDNAMSKLFATNFTDEITYNGETIRAHVEYGGETGASIDVQKSDVANPSYRDTVVIDGVTWYVYRKTGGETQEHNITGDRVTWKIPLYQDERPPL